MVIAPVREPAALAIHVLGGSRTGKDENRTGQWSAVQYSIAEFRAVQTCATIVDLDK